MEPCCVSLVIPIFNEQEVIPALQASVIRIMESIGLPWELVYVNDGSNDNSLAMLLAFQQKDSRVRVVKLSRNWGHQSALTAGLAVSRGSAVIMMDADMQDPPELIPKLVSAWQQGAEVVVAERVSRGERGIRRLLFRSFYTALGVLSDFPIPLNAGIFGLLDRKAVNAINKLSETNRYLPGLRAWVGFRTDVVQYERANRAAGEPKQTFWRLLKYGLDAIFSFSYKPLRLSLLAGMLVAVLALAGGAGVVICRLLGVGLFGQPVIIGYTSTIVTVLFLGGIQLISVGLLGEYIGRIYDEVKRRPYFLIDEIYETSPELGPSSAPKIGLTAKAGTPQS